MEVGAKHKSGVTFPALPDMSFDLVIATKSYISALLDSAREGDDVDLDELAEEIFRKNSKNILATFKSTLRGFGIADSGDFFIVADRASANKAAFGKNFLCCWPHQLDLAFKWALREMRDLHPVSELLLSLDAIRELTTYCKQRDIDFKIVSANEDTTYKTSPSNPVKTRWLGVLKQVALYIKAKDDVLQRATTEVDMTRIVEKIN